MLTDVDDDVLDPFAGSCVTGEVCEKLERNWLCCEIVEEYVKGVVGRFLTNEKVNGKHADSNYYKVYSSSSLLARLLPICLNQSITDAIEESSASASLISTIAKNPRRLIVQYGQNVLEIWVYIWTLTHGGGAAPT